MDKEKKLLVTSDDYGRYLTGVQNLRKKHKRFNSELGNHEPTIQQVQEAGAQLIDSSDLGGEETTLETFERCLGRTKDNDTIKRQEA